MSRGIGEYGSGGSWIWRMAMSAKLERLEQSLARAKKDRGELREVAAKKLQQGASLTRSETAAFWGVSTKKVQRMEARGQLRRCPGLDGVVRYAARDVLRLASANGKEA